MTRLSVGISSDTLSPTQVQEVTRALRADIERHTDAQAEIPEAAARAHHKGEPVSLGILLVTLMTSGTAVALVNVLKSYLERDHTISFTVERPDGSKITINAANLGDAETMWAALQPREGA